MQQLHAKIAQVDVRDQLKNGARRYLKLSGANAEIDLKKAQEDPRYDGKRILRTTTSLLPDQVAFALLGRVENAFLTLKTPLELRPLFHTSESGVRGPVQACVLAYGQVRVIKDRLDATDIDINAKAALQGLARIQRVPLARAGITVTKTGSPTEHQQRLLAALYVPLPERRAAV